MVATWVLLVPFAAGMAAATAYLVRWAAETRTALRASTVVFLLLMMVAMVGGAAIYYAHPGTPALVEGLWVASALMSVSVLPVFAGFLTEARRRLQEGGEPAALVGRARGAFVGIVIVIVLGNELLMGWTFSAAAGQTIGLAGGGAMGVVSALAATVNSPWFLFTMAGEMVLSAYLLRGLLPRSIVAILLSQSAIMAFSPTALADPRWAALAIYVSSAAMIGLFVYFFEFLYRHRGLSAGFSSYLLQLLGIYALMMAGLYLWFVYDAPAIFALSVVLEMVIFFGAVVWPNHFESGTVPPWPLRPAWTTAVLGTVFVAELFMGALLDAQLFGADFLTSVSSLPLSGAWTTVVANAVANGFWFVATTTNSTWFLGMMGLEMGALVVFKYRETRNRETRARLLLMMGSYAAFATFFPSLYYNLAFPHLPSGTEVPVLGWNMGIGSAQIAAPVFGVLLVTYGVLGGLTVLFGRRAVCSVFCQAPLMFQGTTIDAMKSFNRSSPFARKYLSSRLSTAYSTITGVVMVSLALGSVASYLDGVGLWDVRLLGEDPTVFLYALYFSVLWYVFFVTIPYAGNYNCVTMGWCYTGQISAFFSRLGFFRLKVKDREVCKRCTTVDCAKSCPVGLVDMPGHFRRKGSFRSSKCCGVGDCVEACPYGNMYFYDVRHWLREKLGRSTGPVGPNPLRVLPPARAASSTGSPTGGPAAATASASPPVAPDARVT